MDDKKQDAASMVDSWLEEIMKKMDLPEEEDGSGTVLVASADDALMRPLYADICEEVVGFVTTQAQKKGYHFVGRPLVRFMVDPALKSGRFAVFAENVDAQSARIVEAAGQVSMGAVEVAALGEAFGHAVRLFGETSDRLMTTLARIEGALEKSSARSDEQLGYYVAQARELIDLSVASQRQVVEDLARLARNEASSATEMSLADEA